MAHEISVNINHAKEDINISAYPDGLVFNPSHKTTPFVLAKPSNSVSVIGHHVNVVSSNTYADNSVTVINVGSQLNITLGTLVESPFQNHLDSFTYQFDDFVDPGIETAWGGDGWDISLKFGDVVYLKSDLSETANEWNAVCRKAFVDNVDYGAFNTLFIFISHINDRLILMHKGFFDLNDANISQWTAGRALYLNENHILDITPTGQANNWVRSLGYCVPNKVSKKRIWFEPDSTYIKIN